MVIRPDYLEKIKPFMNVKLVKILSGIRRCGKSTILAMIKQELIAEGIDESRIIERKYTDEEYEESYTSMRMYEELKSHIAKQGKHYLLLDEPQEIKGWEKTVNALLTNYDTDIYVTGSNSKLLSGEISTYLTGRYVMIPVYTLSFKEYLSFKNDPNKTTKEHLQDYIRLGGFPLVASLSFDEHSSYSVVADIYNSVVMRDIVTRHHLTNIDLFNRIVRFLIENLGKTFSANSIVKFLKSESRSISVEAIYNYLEWLEKAFIVYRCKRYDLQGKSVLKTQEKFYLADQSIKYALYVFTPLSVPATIENIVYLELKRRGYDVYIGKNADKEIDFVASIRDERLYVQVCQELPKDSDREIANLLEIKDNYPKIIVTLDEYACGNVNGIKIVHLADFLLDK